MPLDGGDAGFVLRELTTSGAQQDRPLSTDEWKSGTLNLRDDGWGSTSTMTKDGATRSCARPAAALNEFGYADRW